MLFILGGLGEGLTLPSLPQVYLSQNWAEALIRFSSPSVSPVPNFPCLICQDTEWFGLFSVWTGISLFYIVQIHIWFQPWQLSVMCKAAWILFAYEALLHCHFLGKIPGKGGRIVGSTAHCPCRPVSPAHNAVKSLPGFLFPAKSPSPWQLRF